MTSAAPAPRRYCGAGRRRLLTLYDKAQSFKAMSNRNLSRFACERNLERLGDSAKASVYLWTFTTADAPTPKECAIRWKKAVSQLTRKLGFYGVRVFEMHPGGHGMHVHLVTNCRFDVNEVRDITTRCGFGRINVKRIPKHASGYVAKYLGKQRTGNPDVDLPRGQRAWAVIGKGKFGPSTRVKDCDLDTDANRRYRLLSLLYPPASAMHRIALARVARLISVGLLSADIHGFANGFYVDVPSTGWTFWLSPENCWGAECGFTAAESWK